MKVLVTYLLTVMIISAINSFNIPIPGILENLGSGNDSKCIFDVECRTGQFCKTQLPNIIGHCVEGKGESEFCLKDSVCASNDCSFFKCTKRIFQKDGPCKKSVNLVLIKFRRYILEVK